MTRDEFEAYRCRVLAALAFHGLPIEWQGRPSYAAQVALGDRSASGRMSGGARAKAVCAAVRAALDGIAEARRTGPHGKLVFVDLESEKEVKRPAH